MSEHLKQKYQKMLQKKEEIEKAILNHTDFHVEELDGLRNAKFFYVMTGNDIDKSDQVITVRLDENGTISSIDIGFDDWAAYTITNSKQIQNLKSVLAILQDYLKR